MLLFISQFRRFSGSCLTIHNPHINEWKWAPVVFNDKYSIFETYVIFHNYFNLLTLLISEGEAFENIFLEDHKRLELRDFETNITCILALIFVLPWALHTQRQWLLGNSFCMCSLKLLHKVTNEWMMSVLVMAFRCRDLQYHIRYSTPSPPHVQRRLAFSEMQECMKSETNVPHYPPLLHR